MGILNKLFGIKTSKNPEDDYLVFISEEFIKVEHPKRKTEQIFWKNIETIKLINTDTGPFAPDIWLTLMGKTEECLIPQGTKGFEEVYEIVSKYKDFNFENFIKSMSCTENSEFVLWTKNIDF
ncbi:hypothetical protein EGI22_09125 [Lacihabitans sp. LS3-19]|uniref:hypothetical protein n=1 Tax=Lacihabitans sp. LS3-19 TaxID=2487335 RepID=UPI0020CB9718|nr:hypothetical protein [Lacihabitans sp. LS3-19]MCP9768074.1 hypothetical protein [Lacihabitans sp. LS3-19]